MRRSWFRDVHAACEVSADERALSLNATGGISILRMESMWMLGGVAYQLFETTMQINRVCMENVRACNVDDRINILL